MQLKPKALRLTVWTLTCAVLLGIAACGGDDDPATVNVLLREFSVTTDRVSAPQGSITFAVRNIGQDGHELIVIRTNLAPDALPTEANGSYEENGPGTNVIDEIELIEPGQSASTTLTLTSGKYVLICNMVHVEDSGVVVHYALGMRTAFTVE